MNFIDRDNLPIEIKNNELPKEENKSYKMFYGEKIRTSGGFADAIFLGAIMVTCIMWGMLIILAIR